MHPVPRTGSNFRSVLTHCVQVAYGGCWKWPQLWHRCNSRTLRLAASQNGFVHSLGTGIGRVTLLQSLIGSPCAFAPCPKTKGPRRSGIAAVGAAAWLVAAATFQAIRMNGARNVAERTRRPHVHKN